MEHGYDVVVVKDAIGDRDIPSLDGKSTTTASTLVEIVHRVIRLFLHRPRIQ